MLNESDPFWSTSCADTICALLGLSRYINGPKSGFKEFLDLYRTLQISYPNGHCRTSLDVEFEEMELADPNAQAPRLWKTLSGTASRTASCVIAIVNNALGKFCGEWGFQLFGKKRVVNLRELGRRKTALFITTNSISEPCKRITNLLFADAFKELFAEAESNGGYLNIPVHVICDDFAAGSTIEKFPEYISVFRAARISCTLLLQSISQLNSLYGDYGSACIRDNTDTWIFMGSNDIKTCEDIGKRASMSLREVLDMKPGEEIVSRRGFGTRLVKRYPILEDDIYKSLVSGCEKE